MSLFFIYFEFGILYFMSSLRVEPHISSMSLLISVAMPITQPCHGVQTAGASYRNPHKEVTAMPWKIKSQSILAA